MKSPLLKEHIYPYKGIDVKIIMSENDPANLRLYEAFYFRKYEPTLMQLSMLSQRTGGGGGGGGGWGSRAWGGDLTCLKNLPSNSLPTAKSFQSNATKFPHPGLHIAVKYPKAD